MIGQWAALRVVLTLVKDGQRLQDRVWVVLYFASRFSLGGRRPFAWLAPPPRTLAWHSAPGGLAASVESGGLSSWYEISHRHAYVPLAAFEPRAGWNVVDVGANIGAYAVWAAGRMGSGRLIAIEPNPVSFERLQRSMGQLTVETSAYEVACGDTDGEIALHFQPGYTVSSSVVSFSGASETATVRMRRLDDILAHERMTHVDLLKIDVEGAEAMVLRGAKTILGATDRVILETVAGELEDAVTGILMRLGFRLVDASDDHWGIGGLRLLAFERA